MVGTHPTPTRVTPLDVMDPVDYPLLSNKDYAAPSLFEPGNLLREARRQRPASRPMEWCRSWA